MPQEKPKTQQQIIANEAVHHRTFIASSWDGNINHWPTCPNGHPIFTHGDTESGPLWGCSIPECEYA